MASAQKQRYAAMKNTDLLEANELKSTGIFNRTTDQGLNAIRTGADSARRSLTDFGTRAYDDVSRGYGDASTQLNAGRDQAQTRLDQIGGMYQPYASAGANAVGTLEGSLGLGGADARQRAVDAFQTGPGYEFQLGEALKAGTRQAAATGRLDGGGTLAELTRIGSGLANQEYGNWQNRLQGLTNTGMQANAAIGSNLTNQANLDYQQGAGQAALASARGTALGGINTGLGSNLGNSFTTQGQNEASLYGNLGNSLSNLGQWTTGQITNNITNQAQASDAAKNANQQTAVNLGTSIFNAGTKLFGF